MRSDEANRLIEEEAARLGGLIAALEERAKQGDTKAIDRVVKLAKERARLVRQVRTAEPASKPAEAPKVKLTEKQRRFVEAFMGAAAGNMTEAAKLAGYKGNRKSLDVQGSRLASHKAVKAAIEERQRGDPLIATREERQRFWSSVARGEPQVQLLNGQEVRAVPSMRDRLLAAQHLGKANGDFFERIKHEGSIGHEIVVVELPANARGDR